MKAPSWCVIVRGEVREGFLEEVLGSPGFLIPQGRAEVQLSNWASPGQALPSHPSPGALAALTLPGAQFCPPLVTFLRLRDIRNSSRQHSEHRLIPHHSPRLLTLPRAHSTPTTPAFQLLLKLTDFVLASGPLDALFQPFEMPFFQESHGIDQ